MSADQKVYPYIAFCKRLLYTYIDWGGRAAYTSRFTTSVSVNRVIGNPSPTFSKAVIVTDELRERLYSSTLEAWSHLLGTPVFMPAFSEYVGADFHGIPIYPQSTELRRVLMPANSADNLEFAVKGGIFKVGGPGSVVGDWYKEQLLSKGWNWAGATPFDNTYYRNGEVVSILLGEKVRLIYWYWPSK